MDVKKLKFQLIEEMSSDIRGLGKLSGRKEQSEENTWYQFHGHGSGCWRLNSICVTVERPRPKRPARRVRSMGFVAPNP